MRRLIKVVLVALGIRALWRWWNRRREAQALPPAATTADDPADELRRKLAESREDEAAEPPAAPEATVADRRAEVHEQGRSTLDEMKSTDES